ncbi:DUF2059 domain-containing protein [Sphingorhabdus sp. YGSMI21]|uniref:DUF2059 domain-containing protein n=1 Tax=Sphingorhabdus sp. YGSMI21 TaxID=2077182 RepID=UPI000C1E046E|nr:DUF2059 domain-containing protein [Sphingorhabdus sp. YGSMI21]ATW03220.1 hypothetical protein CHN51_06430 [Sphingorhabdus sp. YGSMI21]
MTIFLSLLLAVGGPVVPASDQSAATVAPQPVSPALQLSRILHSEANVIGTADDDQQAVELMQELLDGDPEMVELEQEFPGIVAQFAEAMIPIVNGSSLERLPQLQARQAALYSKTFTDAELAVLIEFYSSPTGRKIVAQTQDAIDYEATMADMKQSPDYEFSAESTLADVRTAGAKISGQMDSQDLLVLAQLGRSGLVPKLRDMALESHQITNEWTSEYSPGEEAALEAVIGTIFEKRMESIDE